MENFLENLNRQVVEAEASLNDLPRHVLNYVWIASNGACDHPEGFHDREWAQGPWGNDPTPLRISSLRHDYHTAASAEDKEAAGELMAVVDTLPDGEREDGVQPIWRPEYNICIQDLEFHARLYRDPTFEKISLHVFKQCLMSYVPRRVGHGDPDDMAEQTSFGALIENIYDHSQPGDEMRKICIKFGVWVKTRCGPRSGWPTDSVNLFSCELEAELKCPEYGTDVNDGLAAFRQASPWVQARERRREEEAEARQQRRREEAQRSYMQARRRRRDRRLQRLQEEQRLEAAQWEQYERERRLRQLREEDRREQAARDRETARRRARYWERRFEVHRRSQFLNEEL